MDTFLEPYSHVTVLVIDDADFSREIVGHILRSAGISKLLFAKDGVEGMMMTNIHMPDLVIVDLIMPRMDGFEYCRQVRANQKLWDIPIIVQTAVAEPEKRADAFNAGATDVLTKPINAQEFVARVLLHLDKMALLKRLKDFNVRVEAELESARQMQNSLLPRSSELGDIKRMMPIDIASYFAASSELSGDFWGVEALSDDELAFYLVDFTGHGVMAALNTFRLHTLISSEFKPMNNPGEYLTKLSAKLYGLLMEQHFATMFYGVIDFKKETLSYACAASPSPVLMRQGDTESVRLVDGSGLPLGIISDAAYETQILEFKKGDTILCYSDALIEEDNRHSIPFEEEDLLEYTKKYHEEHNMYEGLKAGQFCRDLTHCFYDHAKTKSLKDDLTIAIFTHV